MSMPLHVEVIFYILLNDIFFVLFSSDTVQPSTVATEPQVLGRGLSSRRTAENLRRNAIGEIFFIVGGVLTGILIDKSSGSAHTLS